MEWLTFGSFFKRFAFLSCSSCEMAWEEIEAVATAEHCAVMSEEVVDEVELLQSEMDCLGIMLKLEIHVARKKSR